MARRQTIPRAFLNITPFDGDANSLNFFFQQVEDLKSLYSWSEKEAIAFFRTKITGAALRFYVEDNSMTTATSLEAIKSKFLNFFTLETKQSAIIKWNALSMLAGESIRNLAHRLTVIFNKAYPEILDAKSADAVRLTQLLNIVPPQLKIKLMEENVSSFDAAVDRAQTLQDISAQNGQFINNVQATNSVNDNLTAQVNALQTELENLKRQSNNPTTSANHNRPNHRQNFENRNFQQRNFRASRHYQRPHSFNRYRGRGAFQNNLSSGRQQNVQNSQNRQSNSNAVICSFCGVRNHFMANCHRFNTMLANNSSRQNQQRSNLDPNASTFSNAQNLN